MPCMLWYCVNGKPIPRVGCTELMDDKITLRFARGVSARTRGIVRRAVSFWRLRQAITAPISLLVVKEACVQAGKSRGFGATLIPTARPSTVFIAIAAGLTDLIRGQRDKLTTLRGVVFHELAHYEQWRDGKKQTESGARARARTLCGQMARGTRA
jgi:hypothetical protein